MSKRKIGFTIACYDKFHEVGILCEIIKNNYSNFESKIYVGCNHPEAHEKFQNITEIDKLCIGDDINIPKGRHSSEARFGLSIEERIVSCIRTLSNTQVAVNNLLKEEKLDYIITLHSDSWFLNSNKLKMLIDIMEYRNKKVAVHGLDAESCIGLGGSRFYVIDFLHILNVPFLRNHNMFDFQPLDMLVGITDVHSAIFFQLIGKVGLHNVLCYSDFHNLVFWNGKPVFRKRYLAPFCYDTIFDMLHVNIGSFHENLGEALQAFFLSESNMKGNRIKEFIKEFSIPEEKLFSKLDEYELKYEKMLKWRLTNFEKLEHSKSFRYIEKYLESHSWLSLVKKELKFKFIMSLKKIFHYNNKINKKYDIIDFYRSIDENLFFKYSPWYNQINLTEKDKEKVKKCSGYHRLWE